MESGKRKRSSSTNSSSLKKSKKSTTNDNSTKRSTKKSKSVSPKATKKQDSKCESPKSPIQNSPKKEKEAIIKTEEPVELHPIEDEIIIKMLSIAYQDNFDGVKLSKKESLSIDSTPKELKGFGADVYGEVSVESTAALIDLLELGENDVFVDLGSGLGKTVLYVALHTKCKSSIGVEKSKSRNGAGQKALTSLKRLSKQYSECANIDKKNVNSLLDRVQLLEQDIFEADFSKVTKIYWNNVCFSQQQSSSIWKLLQDKTKSGTKILVFKPICKRHGTICALKDNPCGFFTETKVSKLNCTWAPNVNTYVYERN